MPHRPIILGVVGDSAAGKTTLTDGVAAILGHGQVNAFCTDDYHRYSRAERAVRGITPLHPDANDLDLLEQHLGQLASGQPVCKPVYHHASGNLGLPESFSPAPYIIVEGLLAFATPSLRDCYHTRVYLEPDEPLRQLWKLARDCAQRGYSPAQVQAEIAGRQADSAEFVHPQRGWADMVVRFYPAAHLGEQPPNVQIVLRPSLPHPDLGALIARSTGAPMLRQRVGRDAGRLTEIIEIDGRISAAQAAAVEQAIWDRLPGLGHLRPEQIGLYAQGTRPAQSHALGLTQLLIAYHLLLARAAKQRASAPGGML
jgi:phosphoribulokinase